MSNLSVRGSLLLKMTLVFGLIVAIGCLVLSWVSETRAAAALEAEAREAMLKVARQVAETQDSRIQARLYVVESLANKNVIRGRSGDREATLAEKVQLLNEELEKAGSLGFKRLAVLDRDGNAVYQNGSTANLADMEYFRRAMEGNTNVSTSMVSKVDQTVIFGYAAPIRHYATGEIVGAVAGIVDGAKFSELVGSVTYGRTGYAFAVDGTGKIIAHKDTQKALDQENILEEAQSDASLASLADVVAKMVQGEEGVSTYTLQGQEMIIAYAPLKTAGWSIAVTAPRDEVLERAASLRQSVLLVSLLVTVLAVVLTYVMARSISTPIADLAQVVTKFAEYDFRFGEKDKASRHLKRKDEVGQIANALAGMQSNLVNLIRDLKTEAQTLSGNSASLSAASEEMASSSDEVAKAIQQVAAGAGEQAGHLQEILGLMENITTNLERVRTALGRVKANSEDTSARAGAGKKELDNLVGSIEGVREAFKVVVEKLEVLRDSVGQVEEILEVINGIAEQTNLLALNAAIEAARAGEAGRGFAVVAEEVRKLAEQSRASSDKIRELLGSITLRTGEVVSTSEKVTSEVASQLNNVENTIKAFDDILAAVTAIGPLVEATYREVEATVQAKDVALERVQSISAVAEETSASAEEISASAEELSASTQEIASNAQQVLEVARRLEGQVERFQV